MERGSGSSWQAAWGDGRGRGAEEGGGGGGEEEGGAEGATDYPCTSSRSSCSPQSTQPTHGGHGERTEK